jgi:hypothetical protein
MVNEIEAFVTTPGERIEDRLIEYGHDDQGNMETRTVHAGPTAADPVETREIFTVDYMNRIAGYLRQSGLGATQAHHGYLFAPTGQRLCATNLQTATSEWYMYDGDDAVSDYSATATTFTRTASYVQGLGIDSKHVRLDASGAPSYYVPDALGSVGVIIDVAGAVTDARLTNAWGEDLRPPGPDRHGYTLRERMAEIAILGGTAAMHYRART